MPEGLHLPGGIGQGTDPNSLQELDDQGVRFRSLGDVCLCERTQQ
jgi:hypothetical protein